jgi:hypothetical protein
MGTPTQTQETSATTSTWRIIGGSVLLIAGYSLGSAVVGLAIWLGFIQFPEIGVPVAIAGLVFFLLSARGKKFRTGIASWARRVLTAWRVFAGLAILAVTLVVAAIFYIPQSSCRPK